MDPTACLRRINDADTRREMREACGDLHAWLQGGGFAPDWDAYPKGSWVYVNHYGQHPSMSDEIRATATK